MGGAGGSKGLASSHAACMAPSCRSCCSCPAESSPGSKQMAAPESLATCAACCTSSKGRSSNTKPLAITEWVLASACSRRGAGGGRDGCQLAAR
jgi:hypothetical protein